MKFVPVERVDLMYPARTDGNGTTWYRPADGGIGWTSDSGQAHPSYFNPHALVVQIAPPSREDKKR
jgi:hypothetical protein